MKYLIYVLSLFTILAFTKAVTKVPALKSNSFYNLKDTITPIADTPKIQISKDSITPIFVTAKPATKEFFGIASFYSANLEGTKTSTQEIFTHKKLTCASNRFKLNTWLRVTNLSNGKSIIVRVNDRMHPKMDAKGRIVDLSILGAKSLDFIKKGLTKVKVEVVEKGTKK